MFGLLSLVMNAFIISSLIYAILRMSKILRYAGAGALSDLSWMLERTPARDSFVMFMLQTLLGASTIVYALRSISNHGILSFDILFFASMLLLALYQSFKIFPQPPVKVN